MSDIIRILPEHIANQIAAGEVIQRPASVVKELIENSVDAGSTEIKLILKESGKNLIQIIDNGCGMSITDARVCFERHATSKINSAEDLFKIKTKGFRGEALASIASIAHVDLLTRLHDQEIGNHIQIHGSKVIHQSEVSCPPGTNITVKNLFYNIPARRKFLKSNPVELKHCMEEFERVALVHPEVSFSLYHNDVELYNLPVSSQKKRIIHVMGKNYESTLMPLEENTEVCSIYGYIVKPEESKKTRGDQFLFVNHRFIKNNYLHHAIKMAFQDVLPDEYHPGYFIFINLDPDKIDINIHPTKTEVKFEEEKIIYSILRSAVKKSIGQFGIGNTMDFDVELSFQAPPISDKTYFSQPKISSNPSYNPFLSSSPQKQVLQAQDWKHLLNTAQENNSSQLETNLQKLENPLLQEAISTSFFVLGKYLICKIKSGILYIHIRRAWEVVLFNRYFQNIHKQKSFSQQLLFPITLQFSNKDHIILCENLSLFHSMGFEMEDFGNQNIIIRGIPVNFKEEGVSSSIQDWLENIHNQTFDKRDIQQKSVQWLAKSTSMHLPELNTSNQIQGFVDEFFSLPNYEFTPSNQKKTLLQFTIDDIDKLF